MYSLTEEFVVSKLPKRLHDANKGTFGKVLVIAGSENYPGAAYLTCAAAYRAGAGLVTLATIPSVKLIVSKKLPEVTFFQPDEVVSEINKYDVLVVGPGLGQDQRATRTIEKLLRVKNLPNILIDGDGLNIVAKIDNWWKRLTAEAIFTPHPGEMSRLTSFSVKEIQKDRDNIAKNFAEKWNKIIVLKGANTVIASPNREIEVSPFANPLLATAGTGDILSGVIAGFLAQGVDLFDAACIGVYIHGLAGEVLKEKIGTAGALAGDLLPLLPLVIKKIRQTN